MSKAPKKQSEKPSDTMREFPRVVDQLGEVVSNAAEVLEVVSVDSPFVQAFKIGQEPYHTVCGTRCDYTLHSVPGMPGQLHFGVVCPRCMRSLMDGEVWFATHSSNSGVRGQPGH